MKNKKVILIVGLIVLVLGVVAIIAGAIGVRREFADRNFSKTSDAHSGAVKNFAPQAKNDDEFAAPQDALKTGEIAIAVNNLNDVKERIFSVAVANGGNIYATKIAYASDQMQNGFMILQIPFGSFEQTFTALHNMGFQVIQESTKQIEQRNIYPMMQSAVTSQIDNAAVNAPAPNKTKNVSKTTAGAGSTASQGSQDEKAALEPQIAIYPQQLPIQDKGYIKVIFANYGPKVSLNNIAGYDSHMLVVRILLKGLVLLVLLLLLLYLVRRIFRTLHLHRKTMKEKLEVRQATKIRSRAVKVASKGKRM